MTRYLLLAALSLTFQSHSQSKPETSEAKKLRQDAIIQEHVYDGAARINYKVMMREYQDCLDAGLKKDSTIAYLWQQKAMPYFKARKYEVGMPLIDKAVAYDAARWQPYRAFIKCIFAKTYRDALVDFEDCKSKFGNGYVMDHTYDFYMALCYLQLNEFVKAETLLKKYNEELYNDREALEHHTALFYYGISLYEQGRYQEALVPFDKALKIYTQFSDAKCYKAMCLARLGMVTESQQLFEVAKEDYKNGYMLNEDNVVYETYPYQIRWQ